MNNSTAYLPAPRAIKSGRSSGQPTGGQGTATGAGCKEPRSPYGAKIAQTALQSVGGSTSNHWGPFTGPPEYALAVSIIFTKATEQTIMPGTPPKHVLSTSILWNSLLHDSRFKRLPMSEAAPGDIIIESGWHQAGYAGFLVDHGRIVSNSSQGVENNSSLMEIQRNHPATAIFRYIGVQGRRSHALANANFSPDEARVPAGQTGGGQWTTGMAPSTTILSGGNNWTPGGRMLSSEAEKGDGKVIGNPDAPNRLTDTQRNFLRQKNAEAVAIIARYGDKSVPPYTPEFLLNGHLEEGTIRQRYKGYSDADIALMESTRMNGVRALVDLAHAGKLSKSQVTALQLRGMGVLAEGTLNLALVLAPYDGISALVSKGLLSTAETAVGTGVREFASLPEKVVGDTGKAAGQQDILNFLKLRERQLVLGVDPVRRFIPEEGIGGARLEQALGRTITRSTDPAADFIDSKLGPISLKGPLPEKGSIEGLAKSVIEDAMGRNTATRTVVVDTLGLSEQDTSMLKSAIQAGTKGTKKQIIYLH